SHDRPGGKLTPETFRRYLPVGDKGNVFHRLNRAEEGKRKYIQVYSTVAVNPSDDRSSRPTMPAFHEPQRIGNLRNPIHGPLYYVGSGFSVRCRTEDHWLSFRLAGTPGMPGTLKDKGLDWADSLVPNTGSTAMAVMVIE